MGMGMWPHVTPPFVKYPPQLYPTAYAPAPYPPTFPYDYYAASSASSAFPVRNPTAYIGPSAYIGPREDSIPLHGL
jgi:hypothetical protein